ncbi:G-protein alpha subunit-domain-containing protein [Aspergillus novoparasiticus]|uniref:G-protein alpha subunit-domain-containing protein n=1 Tax=Aspergillus novoparasiticus TaxID=986946 RepID=A0A5N6EGM0_9EURO|nr:G-protein alpha subunit-domain-containing protein [Aspergillus novoparasiticus]
MSLLDQRLSRMQQDHLTMREKTGILWHEKETTDFQSLLNNQVNALNLLLTALQCKSIIEQSLFLQRSESRVVLNRIKDDTSSLLWLRDSDSEMTKKSTVAEDLSLIEARFAFDTDLFSSRVYCSAARSTMVHALRGTTIKQSPGEASIISDDNATERAFSIMSNEEASSVWKPTEYRSDHQHHTRSINAGRAWSLREGLSRPRTAPSLVSSMFPTRQRSRATSLLSVRQAKRSSQWLSSIALWDLWGGEASPYPSGSNSPLKNTPVVPTSQRVLLLGSSKSGKSTALNVLNLLVGGPSNIYQLFQSKVTVLESLSNQLQQLLEVGEGRYGTGDSVDQEYAVMRRTSDSVARLLEALHEIPITQRQEPDYMPTLEDIMWCYTKSTGITMARYTNGPSGVIFCDASGSRGERKKWGRIFDGATKVLYFVDAGSYDQCLTEEHNANRLADELTLFDCVCSAEKLNHVEIVLFIHKMDKLERKLRTVPFDSTEIENWGTFSGEPQSVDDVKDYLSNTFSAIAQKSNRSISVTFTSLSRPEEFGKTILSYASSFANML